MGLNLDGSRGGEEKYPDSGHLFKVGLLELAHGLAVREINDAGMKARLGPKQPSEWS